MLNYPSILMTTGSERFRGKKFFVSIYKLQIAVCVALLCWSPWQVQNWTQFGQSKDLRLRGA